MGTFQSFAEALENKIRQQIERENQKPPPSNSSEAPEAGWTRLVGEMPSYRFQSPQKATAYHLNRRPVARPSHVLNDAQKEAWAFFQAHLLTPLSPAFTRADLKRAFRALALRLHPDQGGTATQIQSLLKARQQLELVFPNP